MIILQNQNIIIANKNTYTQKEKAKEILFNNTNIDDFKLIYIYNGEKIYKKIK